MLDISRYANIIEKTFPKESAEYDLMVETYNTLMSGLPTTGAQAYAKLSTLDSLRPQLSSLIYMLSDKWYQMSKEHSLKYYRDYTRWSNAGTKSSHAAIEAQIYRDDVDLLNKKYVLEDLNNLLEFVKSMMKSLDQMRLSTIEAWRDSNHI